MPPTSEAVPSTPVPSPVAVGPSPARWAWLPAGLDRLAESPPLLFAVLLALNAVCLPYHGLYHDAVLYAGQAMNRATGGRFATDLYFRYGSQDRYSLFSAVAAPVVQAVGLQPAFFLLYLLSNGLWLYGVQRLCRSLFADRRVAVIAALVVAVTPIAFGGQDVFHVNEQFLTPRVAANALVVLALARMLDGGRAAALALLLAAFLLHPLMALGGFLVFFGYVLFPWATPGRVAAIAAVVAGLACWPLVDPEGAAARLGVMDAYWRAEVLAVNGYNFPAEWSAEDWFHIGAAGAIALLAVRVLETPAERRFVTVVLVVALAGLAATCTFALLPYALPLQGQPYRALWLLQLLQLPLGVAVAARWADLRRPARVGLVLWALTQIIPFGDGASWLLALALLGLAGLLAGRGADADRSGTYILGALVLFSLLRAVGGVASVAGAWASLWAVQPDVPPVLAIVLKDTSPFVPLALAVAAVAAVANWPRRTAVAAFSASGVLASALMAWLASEPARRPPEYQACLAMVRDYLGAHPAADDTQPPTVYWPVSWGPAPVWFGLEALSYFDRPQLFGNMFSRGNALEGRRRAHLVAPFEVERYHRVLGNVAAQPQVERLLGAPWSSPPPGPDDFRALAADPGVDVVVLPGDYGPADAAAGGWRLYDLRARRGPPP